MSSSPHFREQVRQACSTHCLDSEGVIHTYCTSFVPEWLRMRSASSSAHFQSPEPSDHHTSANDSHGLWLPSPSQAASGRGSRGSQRAVLEYLPHLPIPTPSPDHCFLTFCPNPDATSITCRAQASHLSASSRHMASVLVFCLLGLGWTHGLH